jgi:hypothetical protein
MYEMKVNLSSRFSAQAGPYPQTKPARLSKNRSPPPRSRSRSASIVLEANASEVTSGYSPGNRGSRRRTANRRVHFSPESEDEQVMDPKDNVTSEDLLASESPARALPVTQIIQIQRTDRGSSSQKPGTNSEHANTATFRPVPIQRLRPDGDAGVIEEMSSDEGEAPENHTPGTGQTRNHFRKGDDVRSGIKNLLNANREAPVVGANFAVILESLLSQMNQGGNEGLVLSFPPVRMMTSFSDHQHNLFRMTCPRSLVPCQCLWDT